MQKCSKGHRIDKVEFLSANYHFPRFVGRNSQLKPNGQYKKDSCVRLYTDQGAVGWEEVVPAVIEKINQVFNWKDD